MLNIMNRTPLDRLLVLNHWRRTGLIVGIGDYDVVTAILAATCSAALYRYSAGLYHSRRHRRFVFNIPITRENLQMPGITC